MHSEYVYDCFAQGSPSAVLSARAHLKPASMCSLAHERRPDCGELIKGQENPFRHRYQTLEHHDTIVTKLLSEPKVLPLRFIRLPDFVELLQG